MSKRYDEANFLHLTMTEDEAKAMNRMLQANILSKAPGNPMYTLARRVRRLLKPKQPAQPVLLEARMNGEIAQSMLDDAATETILKWEDR